MALQHLRSSTANKRPTPAGMSDGQLALNTNNTSPGLFFKDSNGALVKVGPVHVGTTAPNATPGSGGSSGNAIGEQWLDTTGGTYVFKVWDGSAWRSESGTFVDVNGDVMTGALGIIAGSAGSPGLYFSGDTNTGIYSPGADQVAISTGGSGRLFVDASGNVGLGITPVANTLIGGARGSSLPGLIELAGNGNTVGSSGFAIGQDGSGVATLFQRANAAMYFATNGTERLRITSAGLVGVGTSAPSATFHVVGTGLFTGSTQFNNGVQLKAATQNYIYFDDALSLTRNGVGDRLTIDSSGRVGVGTTSPGALLHLSATAGNQELRFSDTTNTAMGRIYESNGLTIISETAHPIIFQTNAAECARIDSSGRLGIGNSIPGSFDSSANQLVVGSGSGNQGLTLYAGNTSNSNIYFADGTAGSAPYIGFVQYRHSDNRLDFGTNDGTRMSIDSSGRVGIGTTSPTNALTVKAGDDNGIALTRPTNASNVHLLISTTENGADAYTVKYDTSNNNQIFSTAANGGSGGNIIFRTGPSGTAVERMRISSTGDASFFTTSVNPHTENSNAGFALSPDGTFKNKASQVGIILNRHTSDGEIIRLQRQAVDVGSIDVTTTATSYNTSSDYRLKENVVAVTDGILRLQQLKPSRFNFIADPTKTVDGFIAHEVQGIVPEAITGTKDEVDNEGKPVYQGIDQSKLVPLLTAALQEAIGEIESLKARVAALETL